MSTYKTPGVYVEEISTLPPSVATVSTAIPAFIGYTEKYVAGPVRIDTLLHFTHVFGGPKMSEYSVNVLDGGSGQTYISGVSQDTDSGKFSLYYSLDMYFRNGGGACYIASAGSYDSASWNQDDFKAAIDSLEKEDEPTLLLAPDATKLSESDHYAICQLLLSHAGKMKDRFAILDVRQEDTDAGSFRDGIGTNYLDYGAAYYPYLSTSLTYKYTDTSVSIIGLDGDDTKAYTTGDEQITVTYTGAITAPKVKVVGTSASDDEDGTLSFSLNAGKDVLSIQGVTLADGSKHTGKEVLTAWESWSADNDTAGFKVLINGTGNAQVTTSGTTNNAMTSTGEATTMADIQNSHTALYSSIQSDLSSRKVTLPPSGSIAGIYANVDRERGVWKAPANVSLSAVNAPALKINNSMQDNLNVDPTSGKSINAIRAFAGKGILVWGARTLAGNSNEWRYVSVRRLFINIEESIQKSTQFAVFESNDAGTWLKVKAMIQSYLYSLWQQGALSGTSAEQAYYVNVGLGSTMTPQDVLEGKMNIEIGVAAVRPAEFIVLKFSHYVAE